MGIVVAIIGRPNVGKSTLLNRLTGKSVAIVSDFPGVTRDWQLFPTADQRLSFLDTPGLETLRSSDNPLMESMWDSVKVALNKADVLLFLLDGKQPLTSEDQHIATWARSQNKPILLVVNKCESEKERDGLYESFGLGLGEPLMISAQHGLGIDDLLNAIYAFFPSEDACDINDTTDAQENPEEESTPPLAIAVLGRPNAGKSSFINKCLGYERLLTSPLRGTTRDAVPLSWTYNNRAIRLIDTAGLGKRKLSATELERLSSSKAFRAMLFAHVVVMMIDASEDLESQDFVLLHKIINEGRGVIIALTKWDLISPDSAADTLKRLQRSIHSRITGGEFIPIIPFSSLSGKGFSSLWKSIFRIYERWDTRISTGPLNRFLHEALAAHPPPLVSGRRIKIKFITQERTRPPTFVFFGNQLDVLDESYKRYLRNALSREFEFTGVPLRLIFRTTVNPFAPSPTARCTPR